MNKFEQRDDEDRPVVCINKLSGIIVDVYDCADDAECIRDDSSQTVIALCNEEDNQEESKYIWKWYNPEQHGTFDEIIRSTNLDMDDTARDVYDIYNT